MPRLHPAAIVRLVMRLVSEPTEIRVFGSTVFIYEFLVRMAGGVPFALVNLCASLRVLRVYSAPWGSVFFNTPFA